MLTPRPSTGMIVALLTGGGPGFRAASEEMEMEIRWLWREEKKKMPKKEATAKHMVQNYKYFGTEKRLF